MCDNGDVPKRFSWLCGFWRHSQPLKCRWEICRQVIWMVQATWELQSPSSELIYREFTFSLFIPSPVRCSLNRSIDSISPISAYVIFLHLCTSVCPPPPPPNPRLLQLARIKLDGDASLAEFLLIIFSLGAEILPFHVVLANWNGSLLPTHSICV